MSNIWVLPMPKREPEFEIIKGSNGKQGIETKGGLILYHPVFDSIVRFTVYGLEEFEEYVYRLEKNGKYGLTELEYILDAKEKQLLPIEYEELNQITHNRQLYVIARKDNKYGLYSRIFKWILPLEYDNMSVVYYIDDWSNKYEESQQYLLYQKGDKFGIVFIPYFHKTDAEFEEVLSPIDEYGIRVKKNGRWGHLNKQRKFTLDLSQVPMAWNDLSDIYIDRDTRILHEISRGKKQIKSTIDIPKIDLDFNF